VLARALPVKGLMGPSDGDNGINRVLQAKVPALTVRNRVPVQCQRDRFEGRALGLGVDLLQGGRRRGGLAAGNSLVFAVEKLILAAGTGLFPSEGCSGAPNFQYSDPTTKCHFRALSIEVWPCGKAWLSRGILEMGEQRMWMEYSKWWKWFNPPRGHTSWCAP
jgi:hypothetical protein